MSLFRPVRQTAASGRSLLSTIALFCYITHYVYRHYHVHELQLLQLSRLYCTVAHMGQGQAYSEKQIDSLQVSF